MREGRAYKSNGLAKMMLDKKMNGIFYTPKESARFLAKRTLSKIDIGKQSFQGYDVLDPMVGSGELLCAICEEILNNVNGLERIELAAQLPSIIYGADKDENAVALTKVNLANLISKVNPKVEPNRFVHIIQADALKNEEVEKAFAPIFNRENPGFSVVIANPPWEVVKVNDREFFSTYVPEYRKSGREKRLQEKEKLLKDERINERYEEYKSKIANLKKYLNDNCKFHNGNSELNLYRASLERFLQLARKDGIIGVITPTGLAGDYGATPIRRELLFCNKVFEMWGFSIGAKLFPEADVSPLFTILSKGEKTEEFTYYSDIDSIKTALEQAEKELTKIPRRLITKLSPEYLTFTPIASDIEFGILDKLYRFPLVSDRSQGHWSLEIGRELDETNDRDYLTDIETPFKFLKGRDIHPFQTKHVEKIWVKKEFPRLLEKLEEKERIVWRDIARSNKERRMFASIAPHNYVPGNSLNYFKERLTNEERRYLLGIWNSLLVEYRLRQLSTNNHFNMYVTRQIPIPRLGTSDPYLIEICKIVSNLLGGYKEEVGKLEAMVAHLYGLNQRELDFVLSRFPKISSKLKEEIRKNFADIQLIQNHDTAALSNLDLQIVKSVPEGGNWKNIPISIPSKRLSQIRANFKAGNGSRSTYYGRIDRKKPAYTISTHFSRPGNGCNIHPTQDRTLSAREAARLQSFPDWFRFCGKSKASIFKQIGNAVPPLLSYAVAKTLPKGIVIDLFSGAGGMSLGFHLAGHTTLTSLELDENFVQTYKTNIPTLSEVVTGDIRKKEVTDQLIARVENLDGKIRTLIGGPPCQGFSEAGNKRSKEDLRNSLYLQFIHIVSQVQPQNFVMENVPGLLTLDEGRFYQKLLKDFKSLDYEITPVILWAHEFGVPQKRKRVFIIGTRNVKYSPPVQLFSDSPNSNLPKPITAGDALENLPPLPQGSWLMKRTIEYSEPQSNYIRWLRGQITTEEMLELYGGKPNLIHKPLEAYFQ
ncbi:MAG: DNA (cytosine-5-)-methyltransferase [Candidatus Bathyarchaeia archaeon]|jgi:DNA-cytosine methyltransferase